jgi:hypothetical protein
VASYISQFSAALLISMAFDMLILLENMLIGNGAFVKLFHEFKPFSWETRLFFQGESF